MKDALNVKDITDQAAQLKIALTAANDKAGAEAQHAQAYQQQLEALHAGHYASVENTKVTLTPCVPTSMITLPAKA